MHVRRLLLGSLALLTCASAQAYVMERELAGYDLRLATQPTRSMAQGLIQPSASGTFHGGLDLSREDGWYFGGWAPSMGLLDGGQPQLDAYAGLRRPLDDRLGYEVGLIRYSRLGVDGLDHNQYYAGLTLLESRFGLAVADRPGRQDGNLLLDLALPRPLDLGMTLQYGAHRLDNPVRLGSGAQVRSFGDWSLNLTRAWGGNALKLSYGGSSLGGERCAAYSGNNGQCEGLLMIRAERPLL